MPKPMVAIIGKPNVGKSTFFNYIIGQRLSVVEDIPGVTRDRIYGEANWRGRDFTLIDTGGIEPKSDDVILSQMREQADIAISIADVIIFITDVKQGVTAADQDIALMLKKSKKPIVLVCNKADNFGPDAPDIYEFYLISSFADDNIAILKPDPKDGYNVKREGLKSIPYKFDVGIPVKGGVKRNLHCLSESSFDRLKAELQQVFTA